CAVGFTGDHCEHSQCDGYCFGNATCTYTMGMAPLCACPVGFRGKRCEIDSCREFCQNGGTCRHRGKKLTCDCPPGYMGRRCDIYTCGCQNDGRCMATGQCQCRSGFTGPKCEVTLIVVKM